MSSAYLPNLLLLQYLIYCSSSSSSSSSKRVGLLIEAVLGVTDESIRHQVRQEWSRQALHAACYFPACIAMSGCASAPPPPPLPARSRGGGGGGSDTCWQACGGVGGGLGGGRGVSLSVGGAGGAGDVCWLARRRRSHALFRALAAAVGVADVVETLGSLARCRLRGGRCVSEQRVLQLECVLTLRHLVVRPSLLALLVQNYKY
jgi:hypothetical protein